MNPHYPGRRDGKRPGWYNRRLRIPRYFTIVFSSLGGLLFLLGLWVLVQAFLSTTWPIAEGTVIESGIVQAVNTWTVRVEYEYVVDGERYLGDRVFLSPETGMELERARELTRRYPAGEPVKVFHDPDEPGFAVLEPGPGFGAYILPPMGLAVIALGVIAFRHTGKLGPEGGGPRDRFRD